MNCEILTACLGAVDKDGVFTIDGAFNRLTISPIPGVLKELVIAVRICFSSAEDGPHTLHLSVSDLDDKVLGPVAEGCFESKTRTGEQYTWNSAVIRVAGIRIGRRDDYLLSLSIDGQCIANTTIFVYDGTKTK
jgi:hypothetical protein